MQIRAHHAARDEGGALMFWIGFAVGFVAACLLFIPAIIFLAKALPRFPW